MPKNNTNKDIASIKTDIIWIKQEIADIKNNHLAGIYKKLDNIEKDIATRPTWLIAGIFSVLTGLIIWLLTR